jgi:hypothetical protein
MWTFSNCYRRLCERAFYSLSLRERVGVRDSGCPIIAGVPPPNLLPKGGGTKQKDFRRAFYRKPSFTPTLSLYGRGEKPT